MTNQKQGNRLEDQIVNTAPRKEPIFQATAACNAGSIGRRTRMSDPDNTIAIVLNMLAKRWTLSILKSLSSREVVRFSELRKAVGGISNTVLAERLLELERKELVTRKVYGMVPPKVEYSLTARAVELFAMLEGFRGWHARWEFKEGEIAADD